MNSPFSGRLGESARRYVVRIGALYEKARALVAGGPHDHGHLAAWEWHRTSAQACVDEAVLMYIDGLETLLKEPLDVQCRDQSGRPRFICTPATEPADAPFELSGESSEDQAAAERMRRFLVEEQRGVLAAFIGGLQRLHALDAFERSAGLKLRPNAIVGTEADRDEGSATSS